MRGLSDLTARRRLWWVLQAITALCLAALVALPAHRYEWMRELDPGFIGALPPDDSANRSVIVGLLLLVAVAAQGLSAWCATTPVRRWLALGLGLLCVAVAVGRFGLQ